MTSRYLKGQPTIWSCQDRVRYSRLKHSSLLTAKLFGLGRNLLACASSCVAMFDMFADTSSVGCAGMVV